MKRILLFCLCLTMLATQSVHGQTAMDNVDPQTKQAIQAAIQRGDIETAKKLYEDSKKTAAPQSNIGAQPAATAAPAEPPIAKPAAGEGPSVFERSLSGKLPMDVFSADLHQFGYEIFLKTASSFAPPVSVPVGPDYVIGPGDQFTLTLWGTTEGIFTLQVTKEGNITLPKVGVVPVAGLRFGELETTVRKHLSKYYQDLNLSIAMGSLKTIMVYIVGAVERPGSYALPSLSTVFGALFSAGGPTKKGTLRAIQVLRSGKVIKTIDLYDFLLKGDRSQDLKLRDEDTIFVPLIGPIAGVSGAVYRPAIYELKGEGTISDLIQTAGGIMPVSLASRLQLTRFSENQKKVVLDIQVTNPPAGPASKELRGRIMNMDVIHVLPIYDQVLETVALDGAVEHPGEFQWKPGLTVRDIIIQGQLLPKSDMKRADVIRLDKDMIERKIIPVNLTALMAGDETKNVPLEPKDRIVVYRVDQNPGNLWETVNLSGFVRNQGDYQWKPGLTVRDIIVQGQLLPKADMKRLDVIRMDKDMINRNIIPVNLAGLMAGDSAQNIALEPKDKIVVYSVDQNPDNVWEIVNLSGFVRNQGDYQWKPGLTVRDIIVQGQLLPQSDMSRADVIRLDKNLKDRTVIPVDLAALMAGDKTRNFPLEPQDQIRVYSSFKATEKVTVSGEVERPGEYETNKAERLSDLLRRVGGFTKEAFPYGAVFRRKNVKSTMDKNFQSFMVKMQSQIIRTAVGNAALSSSGTGTEMSLNDMLLANLKAMQEQNEGRVAINITEDIGQWAGSKDDLLLKDGDSITIPKKPQEVMVMGDVHNPGAMIYLPGTKMIDYVNMSGGYTETSEKSEVYVLQANGFAVSGGSIESLNMKPGDTIFVPQQLESHVAMSFMKDLADILYKVAIAILAVTAL